ncbi:MAG: hypothetical protein E7637_09400 [Ruminococcaceae bacterium]|nr:hypothetical protein [Oscillospiraceae bacterium]
MKKRILGILIGMSVCFSSLLFLGIGCSASTAEKPVVSYGLQILSAETDVAISAPIGNDIVFSADVFARGLNLSSVDYITVQSLPSNAAGELLLGSTRVTAGQTVSGNNLSLLTFSPCTEQYTYASFLFTANGGSLPILCSMYLTNGINYTPTVSLASSISLNVSTYRDLAVYGKLSGYDPDGDRAIFEIVSYPRNGSVLLESRESGEYVYTPASGYVGSDSFSYVVRDKYGNYSASATVHLRVNKQSTSVVYSDMKDSSAYNAALQMTEKGVMSGVQLGDQFYFYPNAQVSRAEFLVMAMHAAGITDVPACEKTVFYDDADIQPSMKGYVAAAYELGYISGSLENGKLCFLPNQSITRAEAAVTLNHFVGLCEVPVIPTFADGAEIPVWASDAIYSLNSVGILTETDGCIAPTSYVTRADTAKLLAAMMQYLDR